MGLLKKRQSGSAVVLVLVAVALFGALAYTFMRGAKSGQGDLTNQQARLSTQDMIDFAAQTQRSVSRLLTKGCSEAQLNFDSVPYPGVNPAAPANHSCDVFSISGGGVTALSFIPPATAAAFTALDDLAGTDSTAPDLALYIVGLTDAACIEINRQTGVDNPGTIPADVTAPSALTPFIGTFPGSADNPYNNDDTRIATRKSACVHLNGGYNKNVFFAVMIDR